MACALLLAIPMGTRAQATNRPPASSAPDAARPLPAPTGSPLLAEPEAAQQLPPRVPDAARDTRIEQRRAGARETEVTVTPAGRQYSYTMLNREGRPPTSLPGSGGGLSTPRFFKLDF